MFVLVGPLFSHLLSLDVTEFENKMRELQEVSAAKANANAKAPAAASAAASDTPSAAPSASVGDDVDGLRSAHTHPHSHPHTHDSSSAAGSAMRLAGVPGNLLPDIDPRTQLEIVEE